jgi:hypothetical protein
MKAGCAGFRHAVFDGLSASQHFSNSASVVLADMLTSEGLKGPQRAEVLTS